MALCGSCGQPVSDTARFCSQCGAAVSTPAAPREARKVVTALFADVVGSTAMGELLDPEDFKTVVGGGVSRMVSAVGTYGGEVIQLAGDGFLALFGAPTAHEDDPERAILAGLRIVEEIGAYSQAVAAEWGIENFAVRVGIESGLAVLGPVGGAGMIRYGAAGDVLNTAARLESASEPGTVLVGSETHRLVEPLFEWSTPRELRLKGKAAPVIAYEVRARRAHGRRVRPAHARAAFVGRERELDVGRRAIEELGGGRSATVLVAGDAGIGKTRFVAELRRTFELEAAGQPLWLEGHCVSYGEALPYWPFRGVLRDWLSSTGTQDDADGLSRATEQLLGDRAEAVAPLLRSVFGVAGSDAASEEVAPEVLQQRIHDAVAELFERLAREVPLAISIDDLHWADTASLALIDRLVEIGERAPILLVLARRQGREYAQWEPPAGAHPIELDALPAMSGHEMLDSLVGHGTLPADLEQRLLDRAEGNPLYLEELVGSMIDAGALTRTDDGWRFDRDVAIEIPDSVEKVILARIDRLDSRAQDLLGLASVLGRQFPAALLEALLEADADIDGQLRELLLADLLREVPERASRSYAFKHSLIQEAVYRSLLKRRRQELHLAAARSIEQLYADRIGEFWGMLAHHTGAAGDDRRALEYHHRAGDAARRLYAIDEAIEQYGGAVDSASRLGLGPEEPAVRDVLFQRGILRFERGDPDHGRPELEEALLGARASTEAEARTDALIGLVGFWRAIDNTRAMELLDEAVETSRSVPGSARVNALARLSIQYSNALRLERALAVGEDARELAEAGGDEVDSAIAMDALKLVALQLGDLETLRALAGRVEDVFRGRTDNDFYLQWAVLESGFALLGEGRFDEAIGRIREAIELLQHRGHRIHDPLFLDPLCWAYRSSGDYRQALASGRAASERGRELGHREWWSWADATLGWALLEARAPRAAIECLERGRENAEHVAAASPLTRCTALLAWARAMAGDLDAAADWAARADALFARVRLPEGRLWLFGAHAYLGTARAHLACGNSERAEALAAPIAAAPTAWRETTASALLVLGQARAALGRQDSAEIALGQALDLAQATGLPAIEWEAHASLADLGAAGHAALAVAILEQLARPLVDEAEPRDGLRSVAKKLEAVAPPPATPPRAVPERPASGA